MNPSNHVNPPLTSEPELLAYLDEHDIIYSYIAHPPVYTCEQADLLRPDLAGISTKNLFLRDRSGSRFYLAMTDCKKRIDLKALGKTIGTSKLHFGSEAQLQEILGVEAGAVTILGLANDLERKVELLIDAAIWPAEQYLCHPLVNTATLVLAHAALEQFLSLCGHTTHVVLFPEANHQAGL